MPFVAIEGVNGAGKSTIIDMIIKRFPNAIKVKSPMDGFMDELKDYFVRHPESVAARTTYFNTAMGHTSDFVKRVLESDPERLILTDRYWYATEASHLSWDTVYNGSSERQELLEIMEAAKRYFVKPDLVVILEVDDRERLLRVAGRDDGRRDKWHLPEKDTELFNAFKKEYDRIFGEAEMKGTRISRIDSTHMNAEESAEMVTGEIAKVMPRLIDGEKPGKNVGRT
ncbi:MAG: deoxynucleoside kinase [Candidatus Marsarchaeota archaeon]|nr:deoxynucleoside kinase [Candidatus Marsarchaeota archaeon]